jgi:hypothetical protein
VPIIESADFVAVCPFTTLVFQFLFSSQRNLNPPNTLPREGSVIMRDKDVVERSNVEQPSFGEALAKLVFTISSQSKGIQ